MLYLHHSAARMPKDVKNPGTVSLKVLQLEFGLHQAGCTMLNSIWNPVFPNLSGTKNSDTHEMQGVSSSPNRGQNLRWLSQIVEVAKLISPRLLPSKKCEHFPVSFGSLESQFKDTGSSSSETPASIRHWSTLGKASNSGINGCICLIHIYMTLIHRWAAGGSSTGVLKFNQQMGDCLDTVHWWWQVQLKRNAPQNPTSSWTSWRCGNRSKRHEENCI